MSEFARAAIRRLRTGVVPVWQFDSLSVGYEDIKEKVATALSELEAGTTLPLFVKGEWGTGKTHLLSFIRAAALASGFACSRIDLNGWSAALNYPQRLLPFLADDLRSATTVGTRALLYSVLEDQGARSRLASYAVSDAAGDLRFPLHDLLERYDAGERLELGTHPIWRSLQGADLCWSDHGSKREKALVRIGSLASLLRTLGHRGLVLLFDETETIDQLWNIRSRMSAYAVMSRLRNSLGIWCVYGVTPRFVHTVERDLIYAADHGLGKTSACELLRDWRAGRLPTVQPPVVDAKSARVLARAVVSLYKTAYRSAAESERIVDRCIREWSRNPVRNPRRLVRLVVHLLDADRRLEV